MIPELFLPKCMILCGKFALSRSYQIHWFSLKSRSNICFDKSLERGTTNIVYDQHVQATRNIQNGVILKEFINAWSSPSDVPHNIILLPFRRELVQESKLLLPRGN